MFTGTWTPLITPFTSSSSASSDQSASSPIDFESLAKLIDWQIGKGITGFISLGTSGESVTLSAEEKISVIRNTIEMVRGRVPVWVGTGTNDTRKTIEFTRIAKELGAAGALVVSPYYNRPTQEGLVQHFMAVAREGGLPVMLYDVPGRTGVEIQIETYRRLSREAGIIGVKLCSDSLTKTQDLFEVVPDDFSVLTGDCGATFLTMTLGGRGAISASANVIPAEMAAIVDKYSSGDILGARTAQFAANPIIKAVFAESNPIPAKAALAQLGIIKSDAVRLPLVVARPETRTLLARVLKLS